MSPTWPAGSSEYAHDELPRALLHGASMHARRAFSLYPGDTSWDAQQLAICIGTSIELLTKSGLSRRSYHLLADHFSVATTLTLDGKATTERHLPQLTTVGGLGALERLHNLVNLHMRVKNYTEIFQVRNAALHLGIASRAANEAAFRLMVELTDRLLPHAGDGSPVTPERYWGTEEALAFVRDVARTAHEASRSEFRLLLHQARQRYQPLSVELIASNRTDVLEQIAKVRPLVDEGMEEARPHVCPSCHNQGWVVYEVHRGAPQYELDDGTMPHMAGDAFVDREADAAYFECFVCRLVLEKSEHLLTAEVPLQLALEPDTATEEEIEMWESRAIERYLEDYDYDEEMDLRRGR